MTNTKLKGKELQLYITSSLLGNPKKKPEDFSLELGLPIQRVQNCMDKIQRVFNDVTNITKTEQITALIHNYPTMTAPEIAKRAKCSRTFVYQIFKNLNIKIEKTNITDQIFANIIQDSKKMTKPEIMAKYNIKAYFLLKNRIKCKRITWPRGGHAATSKKRKQLLDLLESNKCYSLKHAVQLYNKIYSPAKKMAYLFAIAVTKGNRQYYNQIFLQNKITRIEKQIQMNYTYKDITALNKEDFIVTRPFYKEIADKLAIRLHQERNRGLI